MDRKSGEIERASSVYAEEQGLVTAVWNAAAVAPGMRLPSKGIRFRTNPPESALREDGHVFDLAAALAFVDAEIISRVAAAEPRLLWTDTIVGCGRVTVSFGTGSEKAAREVKATAKKLLAKDLLAKGWKLEEAIYDSAAAKRVRLVIDRVPPEDEPTAAEEAIAARLAEALAGARSPGSFRKHAGFDERTLDVHTLVKALQWLSKELGPVDSALREALGAAASRAPLGVQVNAHPGQRLFLFDYRGDGSDAMLPRAVREVIARFLDAPEGECRRICGPFWEAEVYTIADAPRVNLDASS